MERAHRPASCGSALEDPIRSTDLNISLDPMGRATMARFTRWGDPDGKGHREVDFGVLLEEERTFGGPTIPSRIRAGWFLGTERFETEGEFFRATIDNAAYK